MDGQIMPIAEIERAARSAVEQGDTTNPYPAGTPAHDIYADCLMRLGHPIPQEAA